MVLLDTSQSIAIVVYVLIGVFIIAIVIGSICGAAAKKKRENEDNTLTNEIKDIIKNSPDNLFEYEKRMTHWGTKEVYNALSFSLDWDVKKKFLLMKKLGLVSYHDEWMGVKQETIVYNDFYYLDFQSVLYHAFDKCFERNNSKSRKLKDYKEGLRCYLLYKIISQYENISSAYSIRKHKGLQELNIMFCAYIGDFVANPHDPVFEDCLNEIHSIFPMKKMFDKNQKTGYYFFRELDLS